jgi:hypothetical protein
MDSLSPWTCGDSGPTGLSLRFSRWCTLPSEYRIVKGQMLIVSREVENSLSLKDTLWGAETSWVSSLYRQAYEGEFIRTHRLNFLEELVRAIL